MEVVAGMTRVLHAWWNSWAVDAVNDGAASNLYVDDSGNCRIDPAATVALNVVHTHAHAHARTHTAGAVAGAGACSGSGFGGGYDTGGGVRPLQLPEIPLRCYHRRLLIRVHLRHAPR